MSALIIIQWITYIILDNWTKSFLFMIWLSHKRISLSKKVTFPLGKLFTSLHITFFWWMKIITNRIFLWCFQMVYSVASSLIQHILPSIIVSVAYISISKRISERLATSDLRQRQMVRIIEINDWKFNLAFILFWKLFLVWKKKFWMEASKLINL